MRVIVSKAIGSRAIRTTNTSVSTLGDFQGNLPPLKQRKRTAPQRIAPDWPCAARVSRVCFDVAIKLDIFDPVPPEREAWLSWSLLADRSGMTTSPGAGNEPFGDSRIQEIASWMLYRGHSNSHSLPIAWRYDLKMLQS